MRHRKLVISVVIIILFGVMTAILYHFNYIPHRKFINADFGIENYTSMNDRDRDGIDDQSDILLSAREYLATNPKYKSKYYAMGYPDDNYGVCTDVVAFALRGAGYDLMELVDADIRSNQDVYGLEIVDKMIDFRRVGNLQKYFERHAEALTTDLAQIAEWQGGDIVVFNTHIGVVSDKRNRHGVPFILHHANPWQRDYEEDVLEYRQGWITGHFRIK